MPHARILGHGVPDQPASPLHSASVIQSARGRTLRLRESAANLQKHGVSLAEASHFDLTNAWVVEDDREQYDEVRYNALGFLNGNLYHLTFTLQQNSLRAISLRKATRSERDLYAEYA